MIYGPLVRGFINSRRYEGVLFNKLSANYRITFRLEAGNIHDVDYQDYH